MKEIFNYTASLIIMIAMVLCVISPLDVYANEKYNVNSNSQYVIKTDTEYLTTISDAGEFLRAGMVERKNTVIIDYKLPSSKLSDSNWFSDLCDSILSHAFNHTGGPGEGDSLKHNLISYNANAQYLKYTDYTYITITFKNTYYTTLTQEQKLDKEVQRFKANHNLDNKSEYDIVKTIYGYICRNVAYDNSENKLKYTAYNALVNKKAVCKGYSVLFYRLALEYGIDARVITGTGRQQDHAWNIVRVDGKYYNVDATWDAGKNKYDYFLVGSNNFKNHFRDSEFLTNTFKSNYPVQANDYLTATDQPKPVCALAAPASVSSNLTAKFGILAGYDDLKITWGKSDGASGYCVKVRKKGTAKWNVKYTSNRYMYVKDLADGCRYDICVVPYIKINGNRVQSCNNKTITSVYTLKKTKITGGTRNTGNKVTISWNDINGETGYQVFRSKTKNGKYTKISNVKNSEKRTVNLKIQAKKGVTYWYKVRAYKSVGNGKSVYGPWSDKVKFVR